MRRLLTWILVSFGVAALARRLRRREPEALPRGEEADPAAELRQKLADTRSEETTAVAEPPVSPEGSVEDRRTNVHEQGRATVDEMRGTGEE